MKKLIFVIICSLLLVSTECVLAKSGKAKIKKAVRVKKEKKASNLTDKLISIAQMLGAKPDDIEITKYAIKNPTHFMTVVEHGVAQDYPFFALIGAVKAARKVKKSFTQAQCNSPITIIDEVFSKADATIDDAKGKKDTNMVIGIAKEYAANYAKQQTQSAKEELKAELAKNIPYFGQIPTICSFAFETNLQIERDIQRAITEVTKKLNRAYIALKNGNYVDAVQLFIEMGASTDIACNFIDNSVSGGLIGRTPVLGKLALGACKGFTGKVFDAATGVIKGGIGYVEDGVEAMVDLGGKIGCKIYSLVGNGCSSAPPDLTTLAIQSAQSWCAPRGGLKGFQAKVPGQDVRFNCNDSSACMKRPGEPLRCVTAQEKAAWEAQQSARLKADINNTLPADTLAFLGKYEAMCPLKDKQCQNEVGVAVSKAAQTIIKNAKDQPTGNYQLMKILPFKQADLDARNVVQEADFRVLPQKWVADFNEKWIKKCNGNEQCNKKLTFIRNLMITSIKVGHQQNPTKPHSAFSAIYAEGETLAMNYFKNEFQADKKDE